MAIKEKIPQLRVCVTGTCDKNCIYCRPHGEYLHNDNRSTLFSLKNFTETIHAFSQNGVSEVRLTGGEPMLYKQIYQLIRSVRENTLIEKLSIVTRSKKLRDEALRLKKSGIDSITISIDSLNRRKAHHITKCDILKQLIDGAHKCSEIDIPVRINTVMMKGINDSEQDIEEFIHFVGSLGPAKWKILDYMILPGQNDDINGHQYFVNLQLFTSKLREMGGQASEIVTQSGGLGTPMAEYKMPNGISVYVKDSTKGSHYGQDCISCEMFPCQDALMALRLTPNGNLQKCLYRKDKLIDIKEYVGCDMEKLHFMIKDILSYYKHAEFRHRAWVPEN